MRPEQPIPDHLFTKRKKDQAKAELVVRPSLSYWQAAWMSLRKNKLAMTGLIVMLLLLLMAIIGPMISPHSVTTQLRTNANQPPSLDHWFGTDSLG